MTYLPPNPSQICYECGERYGTRTPSTGATLWTGKCEICGEIGTVTAPRDFGYRDRSAFGFVNRFDERGRSLINKCVVMEEQQ